jgi:hypothetical protein
MNLLGYLRGDTVTGVTSLVVVLLLMVGILFFVTRASRGERSAALHRPETEWREFCTRAIVLTDLGLA